LVVPLVSTAMAGNLTNSDGNIIHCSRNENRELFSLVLGGYGLFGVILDVRLKVIENRMYKAKQYIIKSNDYIREFDKAIKETPGIGMIYGRININPGNFMEESILSTFTADNKIPVESLQKNKYASIRRTVFRGSANSGYGKDLRWRAEKLSTSLVSGKTFSRNQLLNEGVDVFENTDTAYTDILHEYFIPKDSVTKFIARLKVIMPKYNVDLLNITLRNIKKDDDTFLRYANEEVFGFVMLFNQAKGDQAEADMKFLTRNLINEAISLKGTYYLPYRLHASKEQLYTVYPQATAFFMLKKKYDPAEVFQNQFYKAYK
jgi:FAD/FMN-containing dehydrogenase